MTRLFVLLLVLLAAAGCNQPEEIVTHRIPKSRSNLDKFDRRPMSSARRDAAPTVPTRMVVGLVERSDATWFFKIQGPVDQVNLAEPVWREFFESLRFNDDGQPEWDLPTGWSKGRSSSMRFATLNLTTTVPPLEMSISSLGPNQNLLDNVNRWRGQLALDGIEKEQIKLNEIDFDGGSMVLFDEVGLASTAAGGPMMGAMGGPPDVPDQPIAASIKFEPIEGWVAGPTSTIVKARLLKTEGDKKAQITIVEMPAAVNKWGENVMRWAGEIGMTKQSGPDLVIRTSKVKVDGIDAQRIRLIEDENEHATIALMAVRGRSAWFFKLTGNKSAVEAGEPEFDKFLTTFKFSDEN